MGVISAVTSGCRQLVWSVGDGLFDCLTMKCCFYDGGVAPTFEAKV